MDTLEIKIHRLIQIGDSTTCSSQIVDFDAHDFGPEKEIKIPLFAFVYRSYLI